MNTHLIMLTWTLFQFERLKYSKIVVITCKFIKGHFFLTKVSVIIDDTIKCRKNAEKYSKWRDISDFLSNIVPAVDTMTEISTAIISGGFTIYRAGRSVRLMSTKSRSGYTYLERCT